MGVLQEIVERRKGRLRDTKASVPFEEIKARLRDAAPARDFRGAVTRPQGGRIKLIAELKKASPSRGVIRRDFDIEGISRIYTEGGASAISVLTEEDYFQGDISYILRIKGVTDLPVLRKDFIFDEYQVFEARAYGADAILLIASILSNSQAGELYGLASELGLSVLFEVHNYKEVDTALLLDLPIIGINNRDLETLDIDLRRTVDIMKDIPEDRVIVSESGIETRDDVEMLDGKGIDALLIGTSLMKSRDIGSRINELFRGIWYNE